MEEKEISQVQTYHNRPTDVGCELEVALRFQQRALNWVLFFVGGAGMQSQMDILAKMEAESIKQCFHT